MLTLLAHRGPDATDIKLFDHTLTAVPSRVPARIALAHNRLAIQDLTDAGGQPMADSTGRFWLLYNGEIYNFVELRGDLEQRGLQFRSRSDTEVLVELLAREGISALSKLDGMFAFLLLDTQEHRLIAVRDRFGIKPLYMWTAPDGSLIFASEIKAFTAHPNWTPQINTARATDFLTRGVIDHTDETMFAGVRQLPAGHLLEVDLTEATLQTKLRRWFDLRPAPCEPEPAARLLELLQQSVTRRLRADVAVGSCLSGGLDSSAIVSLVSQTRADNAVQAAFTAHFPGAAIDEWRFATAVAAETGVEHHAVRPRGVDLLECLDELVWIQDEPFGSASIFAQHEVFRCARRAGVTVMLDGQGADEQLAGYPSFEKVHLLEQARTRGLIEAWRIVRAMQQTRGGPLAAWAARVIATALPPGALLALPRPRVQRQVIARDMLDAAPDPFHQLSGRRAGVTAFSVNMLQTMSLPMLLHFEDRNSMAHGIEARVPFLNHDLVAFSLGLPPQQKIDGAHTKSVLRHAMRGRVPKSVLSRTDKIGFAAPEETWLCHEYRDRTLSCLDRSADAADAMLAPSARTTLRAIAQRQRPYDPILWRVLCFGAWMERFGVAKQPR
jgi:asparagine synthase (glutamine-hydrolysing)